ncbi:MAG: hypothetical protein FJ276_13090 [Planctomycetes bacterium]|nr:hypothetical protein [Planctomycetota bacterium]
MSRALKGCNKVRRRPTSIDRRRWTAQQIINAFAYEEAPRFLIRDSADCIIDTRVLRDRRHQLVWPGSSRPVRL